MAYLYVTEFNEIAITDNGVVVGGMMPPVAEQRIAIGGSTSGSTAFNSATKFVRIAADAVCSVVFSSATSGGAAPTATAANMRVAANAKGELFGVQGGGFVSVITNT